jgi:hypothetical protein
MGYDGILVGMLTTLYINTGKEYGITEWTKHKIHLLSNNEFYEQYAYINTSKS